MPGTPLVFGSAIKREKGSPRWFPWMMPGLWLLLALLYPLVRTSFASDSLHPVAWSLGMAASACAVVIAFHGRWFGTPGDDLLERMVMAPLVLGLPLYGCCREVLDLLPYLAGGEIVESVVDYRTRPGGRNCHAWVDYYESGLGRPISFCGIAFDVPLKPETSQATVTVMVSRYGVHIIDFVYLRKFGPQ